MSVNIVDLLNFEDLNMKKNFQLKWAQNILETMVPLPHILNVTAAVR